MYKIISKGVIIDLVDSLKFYKFLPKSKHFVCTDSSTANCLEGSNYQIYILQGRNFPEGYDYPRVQYALATQADYDKINKLIDKPDYKDQNMLELARSSKIRFLDKACSDKINQGIDIYLSDGYKYHFDLKLEDQLNLRRIEQQLNAGATQYIYHAKDSCSRIFSKEDMLEIITKADAFIAYETTYFNLLKHCIYNTDDIHTINKIQYGDKLIDLDLQKLLERV